MGSKADLVVLEPQPLDSGSSSPVDAEACERLGGDQHDIIDDHEGDLVTSLEDTSLKRGLAERHLSMLGIAGAIGTGLFLSLGGAIQTGGPLGALLGYAVVGCIVCAVQFALGEVTALLPVSWPPEYLLLINTRQGRC